MISNDFVLPCDGFDIIHYRKGKTSPRQHWKPTEMIACDDVREPWKEIKRKEQA